MKTLRDVTMGLALAHGKALPAVKRHLPVWAENASPIVFFTPVDDPLDLPGWPQFSTGRSDAYSAYTNERTREALRFAAYSNMEYALLIEYDSLVFGKIPTHLYPHPGAVTAPKFTVPSGEYCPGRNIQFKGTQFLHFPILFSIRAVRAVLEVMDNMPTDSEGGLTDRYVGYAVEKARCPVVDLWASGIVHTANVIDRTNLDEAVRAVQGGARWHHGVKSLDVFERMSAAAGVLPAMPA